MNYLGDLQRSNLCSRIVEYLRFGDHQRLICSSKLIYEDHKRRMDSTNETPYKDTILWLRDMEVLYSLSCPRRLRNKMSQAIKFKKYYIMSYCQGGHDPQIETHSKTMFDMFESNWKVYFFGGVEDFLFGTVHSLDLEERELEKGEAYDEIIEDDDDDDNEKEDNSEAETGNSDGDDNNDDHLHVNKKQRMLKCQSIFCETPAARRVYYVNQSVYCGSCLDASCFLKLRWCYEHYKCGNSEWSARELPYNNNGIDQWGLEDNQFWARIWYTQPYNEAEIRFIGVGERE